MIQEAERQDPYFPGLTEWRGVTFMAYGMGLLRLSVCIKTLKFVSRDKLDFLIFDTEGNSFAHMGKELIKYGIENTLPTVSVISCVAVGAFLLYDQASS